MGNKFSKKKKKKDIEGREVLEIQTNETRKIFKLMWQTFLNFKKM
jgi:hypothetical protein